VHRDPNQLNPPAPSKEAATRRNLWWWMLHVDQQYSTVLGRPLAISAIGDCPSPEPIIIDPLVQSLSNYMAQFSILGRQVLAAGHLVDEKIDRYTDELLALHQTLPASMQFDLTWLNKDKPLAGWPLDSQAAVLHSKTHNLLILLNRRRSNKPRRRSERTQSDVSSMPLPLDGSGVGRGRQRVLESSRTILTAFDFFRTRLRAGMMCWSMGQMAFNASMILTLSMLETGETQDLLAVQHAYSTFLEMNKLGIHKLAGAAVERLGILMKEFQTEDSANETVMGQHGMILLEDPGLQCSLPESFAPLRFQMAGGIENPGMQRSINHLANLAEASQGPRKKGRKPAALRETKPPKGSKKAGTRAPRMHDRRFSDSMTPQPSSRRRINRSTPNLSLLTSLPGQSMFSAASTPAIKSEALFTPNAHHVFEELPSSVCHSPSSRHVEPNMDVGELSRTHSYPGQQQQQQQQQQHVQHHHHHGLHNHHGVSDHSTHPFDFSSQSTPYSSEFFDGSLPPTSHGFEEHHLSYEHASFPAPSFRMPNTLGPFSPHY